MWPQRIAKLWTGRAFPRHVRSCCGGQEDCRSWEKANSRPMLADCPTERVISGGLKHDLFAESQEPLAQHWARLAQNIPTPARFPSARPGLESQHPKSRKAFTAASAISSRVTACSRLQGRRATWCQHAYVFGHRQSLATTIGFSRHPSGCKRRAGGRHGVWKAEMDGLLCLRTAKSASSRTREIPF